MVVRAASSMLASVLTTTAAVGLIAALQASVVAAPAPQASAQGRAEYRLGPGDVIHTTVWNGNEYAEQDLTVASDGTLMVPFSVNRLFEVNGLTAVELRSLIQAELSQMFRGPVVQTVVVGYESKKALLVGEVSASGQFPLREGLGLLEFILQNGGFGQDADLTAIQLTRSSGQVERINVYDMVASGSRQEVLLAPDDIVYVPSVEVFSNKYFILGEVRQPGIIQSTAAMNLVEAIASAGALTPEARSDQLMLVRVDETGSTRVEEISFRDLYEEGDPSVNVLLRSGDIVYVPRSRTTRVADVLGAINPITSLIRDTAFLYDILRRN
jgi:polysaccharide export outer membrane protein